MKTFIYILIGLAIGIIVYNTTKLDPDNWLQENNSIALFGILSGLCSVLVLTILLISKKIASKVKK